VLIQSQVDTLAVLCKCFSHLIQYYMIFFDLIFINIVDYAYHGHTQSLVDISPYKWAQAVDGKNYCPSTTHVVACPDSFRGKYRGMTHETGLNYAKEVETVLEKTGKKWKILFVRMTNMRSCCSICDEFSRRMSLS